MSFAEAQHGKTFAQAAGMNLSFADKLLFIMVVDVYYLVKVSVERGSFTEALEYLAMITDSMNSYMDKQDGRCANLIKYYVDACGLVADFSKIQRGDGPVVPRGTEPNAP